MSTAVALLWLGTGAARAASQPALASWADAHLVTLAALHADSTPALAYNDAIVQRIEDLLDAATIAVGSLDDAGASARLGEVETLLDAHPELPQAAFLAAERLQVAADVATHQGNAGLARDLLAQARALEAARAPVYAATVANSEAPAGVAHVAGVDGLSAGDILYWDGIPVATNLDATLGRHHARVVRHGRAVWAGWVAVADGQRSLSLAVPAPATCSLDDLGDVRVEQGTLRVPDQVLCDGWAVARPGPHGSVEIARCSESSCAPFTPWRKDDGIVYRGPPQPRAASGWPPWATYLLTGIGVTAATSFALWQGGAFDHTETPRTTFRYQGP